MATTTEKVLLFLRMLLALAVIGIMLSSDKPIMIAFGAVLAVLLVGYWFVKRHPPDDPDHRDPGRDLKQAGEREGVAGPDDGPAEIEKTDKT